MKSTLTKITATQKHLLDLLALYPNGGASAARLKPVTGYRMVLSSVMTAGKPYVKCERTTLHGDAELTEVYSLTEAGKARQQNAPYVIPVPVATPQDNLLWLLERTEAYLDADDPKRREVLRDMAQDDLSKFVYKTTAHHFYTPRRRDLERIIAAVKVS